MNNTRTWTCVHRGCTKKDPSHREFITRYATLTDNKATSQEKLLQPDINMSNFLMRVKTEIKKAGTGTQADDLLDVYMNTLSVLYNRMKGSFDARSASVLLSEYNAFFANDALHTMEPSSLQALRDRGLNRIQNERLALLKMIFPKAYNHNRTERIVNPVDFYSFQHSR